MSVKIMLVDDKGFKMRRSIPSFVPYWFVAVQQGVKIHASMTCDEKMSNFYPPNYKKVEFRYNGEKTPKGILIYKQVN